MKRFVHGLGSAVLSLALAGCIMSEPIHDAVVVDGTARLTFDGRSNDAHGPKVVALHREAPSGEWVVESYESDLGACIDVVSPQGFRDPHCEATSALDLNGPGGASNLAAHWTEGEAAGTIHYGIVSPDVSVVRFEPTDRDEHPIAVTPVAAPNTSLKFIFASGPPGWTRYDIAAYNAAGCLLQREPYWLPTHRQPPIESPPLRPCTGHSDD